MTCTAINELQTHTISQGDTRTPLGAVLKQSGSAIDLTGLTVRFKMVAQDGTVKVAETSDNVTITAAASGQVQYDFQAADVDTPGTYYAWFIVVDASSERDTFPVDGRKLRVDVVAAA